MNSYNLCNTLKEICDGVSQLNQTMAPQFIPTHHELGMLLASYLKNKNKSILTILDSDKWTALHWAARSWSYSYSVQVLLAAAGNNAHQLVTMQNQSQYTALHYAACNGHTAIVQVLLAAAGDNVHQLLLCKPYHNGLLCIGLLLMVIQL